PRHGSARRAGQPRHHDGGLDGRSVAPAPRPRAVFAHLRDRRARRDLAPRLVPARAGHARVLLPQRARGLEAVGAARSRDRGTRPAAGPPRGVRGRHGSRAVGLRRGRMALLSRCALAAVLVLPAAPARAQTEPPPAPSPTEYEVKAAFLYNFARFVEWPAEARHDPGTPFVIAVLGHDPFGGVLDETVAGKTVGGRPI